MTDDWVTVVDSNSLDVCSKSDHRLLHAHFVTSRPSDLGPSLCSKSFQLSFALSYAKKVANIRKLDEFIVEILFNYDSEGRHNFLDYFQIEWILYIIIF